MNKLKISLNQLSETPIYGTSKLLPSIDLHIEDRDKYDCKTIHGGVLLIVNDTITIYKYHKYYYSVIYEQKLQENPYSDYSGFFKYMDEELHRMLVSISGYYFEIGPGREEGLLDMFIEKYYDIYTHIKEYKKECLD